MSIIYIDNIIFNDNGEEREIYYRNCLIFSIINGLSVITGLFYLYFYFIILYFKDEFRNISFFLCIFHILLNLFYFIIFLNFFLYTSIHLTFILKLITMFNPIIVFGIYYWSACLTHNLYTTYYNYIHKITKRMKFYRYLFFVTIIIFYIITLLNIKYNDSKLTSKKFSFVSNYSHSFIKIFYISGLIIIVFIIIKLYYILKKKEDFILVKEYNKSDESKKKDNKKSLVKIQNIAFIIHFLITFAPTNIFMVFSSSYIEINSKFYFLDLITTLLISFSSLFIFCIRLLDPILLIFIKSIFSFNNKIVSNYKEKLLEENALNEFIDNENINKDCQTFEKNVRKKQTSFTIKYNSKEKINLQDIIKNDNNKIDECTLENEVDENMKDKKDSNKEPKTTKINSESIIKRSQSFKKESDNNISKRTNSMMPMFGNIKNAKNKSKGTYPFGEILSFSMINNQEEMNDNLLKLIALSISINDCRIYNNIKEYSKFYKYTIPWENKHFYKERTIFKEYNEKTIPRWLGITDNGSFQFKILSFCPFVFHHIRYIDNISIDDILLSLSPIKNMEKINKVSGGRGNNSLISTWDKKYILKTLDTIERKVLVEKMIEDYHCLMKESKSLLSRIYGIFKIELRDKGCINIMIQKNMNDLPKETKILTFDIKGSTVDRQCINNNDIKLNKKELIEKYKNMVLKDNDFKIIGINVILEYHNWRNLISAIESDSMFLQNHEVTDYSLLIFMHKYREQDIIKKKINNRILPSLDKKYIFNFSIIDYLGPFNFEKRGEKFAKEVIGYIKKSKDKNFSVSDPYTYGKRFRNFTKKIIVDE